MGDHTAAHNRQLARSIVGQTEINRRMPRSPLSLAGGLRDALHAANQSVLIYRRTKNPRAVQLLLGHTKLESTVRYLGIEVDDALDIAEQTEV
jgi:hypothetical protein